MLGDVSIRVTAPVDVPLDRVADTLCAALEGGSNYWCLSCSVLDWEAAGSEGDGCEWAHEAIAMGHAFTFIDEPMVYDKPLSAKKPKLDIPSALEKMATDHTRHFGDLVGDTGDAETGDVLFQLICFGEIVYG